MLLTPLFSQVSSGGVPKSIQAGLSTVVPSLILPHVDKDVLLMEDKIEMAKEVPYRFGTPIEVQYNLYNSGVWEDVTDGRLWRLSIKSDNAYSINLLFDRFILPEGSKLYIYDAEMITVLGAFTHANNKPHETFSTSPTKANCSVSDPPQSQVIFLCLAMLFLPQ